MPERRVLEQLGAVSKLPPEAVESAAALLEQGCAPCFIARYRREETGGLNEDQVQHLADALRDARQLQERKSHILDRLKEHGVLTDDLRERIASCSDRNALEDLYLAARPKRRSRGTLAAERGLEPLARAIMAATPAEPEDTSLQDMAAPFVHPDREVPDAAAALEGARHIIAEWIAETPRVRQRLRRLYHETGIVRARAAKGKAAQGGKYEVYQDFSEAAKSIPSHRVLAIRRGEKEGCLEACVEVDREAALAILREEALPEPEPVTAPAIETALTDAFDRLLAPAFDTATRADLKRRADAEAIGLFAANLRDLLLQAPAGRRRTLGVAPGTRAGCSLAALDEHGQLLGHAVIHLQNPEQKAEEAQAAARDLIATHAIEAVAIGNGAASRETHRFFRALLKGLPGKRPLCTMVNAAGAAAYANSSDARQDLPDLAPGVRAAVSIGRRLQDPLLELGQLDPKLIGIGQYQHDVNQQLLRDTLEDVVRSCVGAVGVDVNRSSAGLLAHVPGLDRAAAQELVQHRDSHGPFRSRAELMALPRVTPDRFEQLAPFVRVSDGPQPLDATAIHPKDYKLVEQMAADIGTPLPELLGNREAVQAIDFARYASESAGEPTLEVIRRELLRPGSDPRPPFRCVGFRDDVTTIEDVQPGMVLDGVVTNVVNFGAFVDIGVDEDGLVHISELADRYVPDPSQVVRIGQTVRVKVIQVDASRRRISLSIKQALPKRKRAKAKPKPPKGGQKQAKKTSQEKTPRKSRKDIKATPEDIARLIAHFESR